jgi:hypothetical protein
MAGGDLASRLTDTVTLEPEPGALDPAPAARRVAIGPTRPHAEFPSLHPILFFADHEYRCTALDAAGNIDVDADAHFVYATRATTPDGPIWITSLITRDLLESEHAINAIRAAAPLPLFGRGGGGRDGVLIITYEDPQTEEAINALLTTPQKYAKAAAYIERVRHTPPELREPMHQRALERWSEMQTKRRQERKARGDVAGRPREPMPYDDIKDWKKWLKIMREHPHSEGNFKFPGVPLVCGGHQPAHIEGARALLGFLPRNKGGTERGPLRDTFLRSAATLLCVPEKYLQVVTQLGITITTPRRKQLYSPTQFGNESRLGVNEVVRYFASIGVTTDEAEAWRAWAAAYVDMELEDRPTSAHAPQLRRAKEQSHVRIKADPAWVLAGLHVSTPGFYDPARENTRPQRSMRSTTQHASAAPASHEAGPSSVTLDGDSRMRHPDDAQEEDVVSLGYEDNENEDDGMGPA